MSKLLMILDNAYKPDVRVKKEIDTLIKLGFEIYLLCWDQDSDLLKSENQGKLIIERIKITAGNQEGIKKIFKLLKFYYLLIQYVISNKIVFHYIYVHDFLLLPLGVFLRLIKRKSLVYDAHEIYHLMEWEKYNSLVRKVIFFIERSCLRFTDYFIVVSESRKNFYSKHLNKNIYVLGNWFDTYDGPQEDLRKKLDLSSEDLIIGYFGTLNLKIRKLDRIINWTKMQEKTHLVIAGTGSDTDEIEKITKSENRIHYLGWIQNIRQYLNSVDYICYFLDRDRVYFNYAAPNTVYLCISHDIPILTNVSGEPKSLIEKYDIGYFIEDIENIKITEAELDKSNNDYKVKVENIKKIKEDYNWDRAIKVYNEIFQI